MEVVEKPTLPHPHTMKEGGHAAKRKHHRRARKCRRPSKNDEYAKPPLTSGAMVAKQAKVSPPERKIDYKQHQKGHKMQQQPQRHHHGGPRHHNQQQRTHKGGQQKRQVCLRPTNVPLLNAPRNSTQFIIDDHDEHPPADSAPAAERAETEEDEYRLRDFQSVYESAHREEVAAWDRRRLCDEIEALEKRQRELLTFLARVDPEVYVRKLQDDLDRAREVNRDLREDRDRLERQEVPDSSTEVREEEGEPQAVSREEEEDPAQEESVEDDDVGPTAEEGANPECG